MSSNDKSNKIGLAINGAHSPAMNKIISSDQLIQRGTPSASMPAIPQKPVTSQTTTNTTNNNQGSGNTKNQ